MRLAKAELRGKKEAPAPEPPAPTKKKLPFLKADQEAATAAKTVQAQAEPALAPVPAAPATPSTPKKTKGMAQRKREAIARARALGDPELAEQLEKNEIAIAGAEKKLDEYEAAKAAA